MGRKSSSTAVSKTSAAASPAVPSTATTGQRSSILRSAFSPSNFQLHLFASVIQGFDSQQLRIHDTKTSRLRTNHAIKPGVNITSLTWGQYGKTPHNRRLENSQKRRKRDTEHEKDVVVAFGTSDSEICMFSPTESKIVGRLTGAHERGIRDFKFSQDNPIEAWSLGGDGNLVQWDLSKTAATRTIPLQDSHISVLAIPTQSSPQIICSSATPYAVHVESDDVRIESFDSFKTPVHTLLRSGADTADSRFFLAASNDRSIIVYDIVQKKLLRSLLAGSEVEQVDFHSSAPEPSDAFAQQLLLALTKNGILELFWQPFIQPTRLNGAVTSNKKNFSKKSAAQVKLIAPNSSGKSLPIVTASIQGHDLVLASADGGPEVVFQRVRWQDDGTGELLFDGLKEVVREKSISSLHNATTNGVKDMSKSHINESTTVVVNGSDNIGDQNDAIEISSSDENVEAQQDEELENISEAAESSEGEHSDDSASEEEEEEDEDDIEDAEMKDAPELTADVVEDVDDAELEQPSFGELLATKHPNTISIADNSRPEVGGMTVSNGDRLALPAGLSLGTVLTQALRTNDRSLLESCLHATDTDIVQNTIQRLDSSLASSLLSKLAERLANRPGRYGHLLTWVQWICVAHGGTIAAQPDVSSKIRNLYRVLNQRAKSLDNLLLLKGKLDMLDAQLTFRKQLQAQRGLNNRDQDEPGMIYIEGEDNWSSDEEVDEAAGQPLAIKAKSRKQSRKALDDLVGGPESSEDDLMNVNGVSDSESEGDSDDEDAIEQTPGELLDEEAEEEGSSADEDEDEDVDSEDEEEEEEEEDSEMDSFINDGSIAEEDDDDDEIDIDETGPVKPATKKSKYR